MRTDVAIGLTMVLSVGCGADVPGEAAIPGPLGVAGQSAPGGLAGSGAVVDVGMAGTGTVQEPVAGVGGAPALPMAMAGSSSTATGGAPPDIGVGGAGPSAAGAASGGAPPTMGAAGAPGNATDPNPLFSFFTTSLTGLLEDCAAQFPGRDCEDGYGGDLGGLEGADAICTRLAQRGNPGDTKTWRAFLSVTGEVGATGPVHAIDRVGSGPWYNLNGLALATDVAGLMAQPGGQGDMNWGRPTGASVILQEMFTDENGDPVSPDTAVVDNHDILTGSDGSGMLGATGEEGLDTTCEDWTSNTRQASGGVWVGHSWPRSNTSGRHWISEHAVNGCEPGVFIGASGAPPANNFTVGGGGGYGAFYCFAVDITVSPQ